MPRLVRNPVLDPPLVGALVRLWTAVSNAGGAVGFVPPVAEADVRPVAEAEFAQVAAGAADLVVAFDAAEPVGFGFLVRNTGPVKGHWATIARLQRDPRRPGSGIGSCVLAELERTAAERGLEFVALSVRAGVGLAPFYEACGYRLIAIHPGWLRLGSGELRDELLFAKPLRGPAEPPGSLRVQRLDRALPLPAYAHPGDAGLDLRAREGVTLAPGERATVPTGLAVAVPTGFVGLVHPRSGLAARHGLSMVNAPGTIDSGYRGEIKVILVNHDPCEPVRLRRGDRIAQLLIQRVETVTVVEVPALDPTPRAEGGLGSTGLA